MINELEFGRTISKDSIKKYIEKQHGKKMYLMIKYNLSEEDAEQKVNGKWD